MSARSEFYDDLRAMMKLADDVLLTDTFPPSDPHNLSASILRQGLAVSAFSRLEGYLASRLDEMISSIRTSRILYVNMPDKLKRFLVVDAVAGLSNKLFFADQDDQQPMAESAILAIAGFNSNPPLFTSYGFSPKGSNVKNGDIKTLFEAFGVREPWNILSDITTEIGSSHLSLSADYKAISKTRNKSAHSARLNVPSEDLKSHLGSALIIGMACDIVISSIESCYIRARNLAELTQSILTLPRSYRFLDLEPSGSIVERTRLTGRPIKRYADEAQAISGAKLRASEAFIILRDLRSIPMQML